MLVVLISIDTHFVLMFVATVPTTVCGVDRRLFFLALIIGGATFNFFLSLISGLVMILTL